MSNCVFGWPIYSDASVSFTPTFSGGSWQASLPLTNLADRRLAKVSRSADALTASTQFDVDLKTARAVGVLALPKVNLTRNTATVRWKGGTSAGASDVYDSGAITYLSSGDTAEVVDGINCAHVHIPSTAQTARYWRCEIVDTGNAAGYVELGRLVIAGKFQPTINFVAGAGLGLETETVRSVTDGGAAVYQAKAIRRSATLVLDQIAESEAFTSAWRLKRQLGLSGQLFFIFDPADTTLMYERAFLAVLRELGALEAPYASLTRWRTAYRLVEEL